MMVILQVVRNFLEILNWFWVYSNSRYFVLLAPFFVFSGCIARAE